MALKYILFDLDGTLIDTSPGIKESLSKMKEELSIDALDVNDINKFIGPPLAYSFGKYLKLKDKKLDQAISVFRKYYTNGGQEKALVYSGMKEILEQLLKNEYILGVATLKLEEKAYQVLEHFNIKKYFNVICGAEPMLKEATKKDIILAALNKMGNIEKEKAILIGDSIYDAMGAKEAQINFMPVSYGFGMGDKQYEKILKSSKFAVNKPDEIIEKIKNIIF
ncbi:MAG: HAD hydrolase-like protein [Oscillospiraceae bacterium]